MLSRDEILAIYAAGPDAVVQVIEALQTAQAETRQQVAILTARVAELEARLNKDSHNSHKPPSSDGLGKKPARPRSQRRRSGKKSGGQPGHPGMTLRLSDHPTERHVWTPRACGACGLSLAKAVVVKQERRQVIDLPAPHLEIIEHAAEHKACPQCQAITAGVFPPEVAPGVVYGPRAKAAMVYLRDAQFLSAERTVETLGELYGLWPSEGTLDTAQAMAATRLEPIEQAIKEAVRQTPVMTVDETGLRVGGRLHWLHVMGSETLTYYARHLKRGTPAIKAIGLLVGYAGCRVHDALASYLKLPGRYALCNAHLLRDLTAVHEETGQAWAAELIRLLVQMKDTVAAARARGAHQLAPRQHVTYEAAYTQLLRRGQRLNPAAPLSGRRGRTKQTRARNILNRLAAQRHAILAFLHDFAVPFDNNQAERDLRMMKVKLKVAGCFRSTARADDFCRIRSYISTLRKQGYSVFEGLVSIFAGQPYMPRLGA
jgi:transposase